MSVPKSVKAGDPCPQCGVDALLAARVPTEKEWAASVDRENPVYLQTGMDTASPEFRAEHGALHQCVNCGYRTRFQPAPEPEPFTPQPV